MKTVCGNVDWASLFGHLLDLQKHISHDAFLGAVRIQWWQLGAEHVNTIAWGAMNGKHDLSDLTNLFGCTYPGDYGCHITSIRRGLRLLSPALKGTSLQSVLPIFGDESLSRKRLVALLLSFTRPLIVPELWMLHSLQRLGELVTTWTGAADVLDGLTALYKDASALDYETAARYLHEAVVCEAGPDDILASKERLLKLLSIIDKNASGSVSYLEMAHAMRNNISDLVSPEALKIAASYMKVTSAGGPAELIFNHRGALLTACRLMDDSQDGFIHVEKFVTAVEVLGKVVGYPLERDHVQDLFVVLGNEPLNYAAALQRFDLYIDASLAVRSTGGVAGTVNG